MDPNPHMHGQPFYKLNKSPFWIVKIRPWQIFICFINNLHLLLTTWHPTRIHYFGSSEICTLMVLKGWNDGQENEESEQLKGHKFRMNHNFPSPQGCAPYLPALGNGRAGGEAGRWRGEPEFCTGWMSQAGVSSKKPLQDTKQTGQAAAFTVC